ncbi:amino acid ABC transporter substrate-binding protein [Anaeromyxobacter oryzisoli]|uniref:amino acid ABC transporter substrate-binding protein n=1 Tax=Anaeromyxobacter oryzisoli TaxID=2925408 RepID=UPI001F590185|nr:amino acid ABC transporter substrate-binding protein [Anaeromyxobacter sp. SG63]
MRTLSALVILLGALPALAADTLVFGAAISITGKTAKEGEYTRDGYQFAIDRINQMGGIRVGGKTYQVALKYYDDETKPERTAQLFEKLINEDKVNLLLGPYGSSPTGTAAPIAERYRIPMVEANGAAESIFSKGYKYSFMIISPARMYLRGIIDAVRAIDPSAKTVAVLGENESFSKEVAVGAAEYARGKGMNVVYDELYPTNAQDVSALLTAIKGKRPDLILGSGHLQDSLLTVKQSRDLGVSPKAMGFSVGPSTPEFRANLGKSADYIFGGTQWTEALEYEGDDPWKTPKAFSEAFRATHPNYDTTPYQVAESAAAVIAYQRAIEKAGSIEPTKVRDALAAVDMMTYFGRIKFDARGVNVYKPMAVEQYQPDGKKYTVWPREVAEKPPVYPMPPWDKR